MRTIDEQDPGEVTASTAKRVAHEIGEELGRSERERRHLPRPGPERAISVATEALAGYGYEPYSDEGGVLLRSCPFHALAEQSRDLVCGLNRELVHGIISGLGNDTLDVSLAALPDECCGKLLRPAPARARSSDEHGGG